MDLSVYQIFAIVSVSGILLLTVIVFAIGFGLSNLQEARQQRADLRRMERRFADLTEVAADWVWETDAEMRFTYISERLRELTGIDPKDVLGKTRFQFTPDDVDSDPAWIRHREQVEAHEPFRDFHYRITDPDGRTRVIAISGKPIYDEQGGFVGYRGTGRELTEVIEAEIRAQESEQMARKVIEGALDAFVAFDEDGVVLDWNARAESLLGWTKEEALGTRLVDLVVPPEIMVLHQRTLARIRTGDAGGIIDRLVQTTAMHRDGTRIALETSFSPIRLKGRTIYYTFMRDIRERLRHQAALLEAKEEAESASRAKSEFLATMSHELRTPLNAILGFSELLGHDIPIPDAKRREYARDIHNSGRHLLDLINDILDLAKIESGRFELYEEEVDLGPVFEACDRLFRERAKQWKVELETDLPNDMPHVLADMQRLKQILINLLSNAFKFTNAGGRVAMSAERGPDGEVLLRVADTGIGMPADKIAMAGEPFVQIDSGVQRKQEGTGLGLSLVKKMTELHGGEVHIDSVEGEGTTVTITLPPEKVFDQSYLNARDA